MSSKALNVCNQSAGLWFCVCDSRGRLLKCFHTHQSGSGYEDGYGGASGEPLREDRSDFGLDGGLGDDGELLFGMDGAGGSGRRGKGLDEQTEIILAATFLVLIILAFISFVIYRCEKNYNRRGLHQSFQMSPSSLSAGGPLNASSQQQHANVTNAAAIPSISVSVQTESGFNTTASSHLHHHTSLVGNGHVINMAALLTGGPDTGGATTTAAAAAYHHHHHTLPHPHFRSGGVSGPDHEDNWTGSRGLPSAQSYRDVREVIALPSLNSRSRDNTLSRDHHLAEIGMRSSCTTENLTRSPSAATGATTNGGSGGGPATSNSGPMDDDLIMDYNDGEYMLGGRRGSSSTSTGNANGASSNNGTHRF